jgi:cyclohexadieny/prephenate dehydrogenase
MTARLFDTVAFIGFGLIGSSLARAIVRHGLARRLVAADPDAGVVETALALHLVDHATTDPVAAIEGADLIVICAPVGAYQSIGEALAPHLKPGAIISDVGSVKASIMRDLAPFLPDGVVLVPGHPVAGTEKSGPAHGFAELFDGRWTILTPPDGTDPAAVERVADLWRGVGSTVAFMDADHHDLVLAITSHVPHLIAYTIVGTAVDLEDALKSEVVKFSASGFRDFTRIAASDPVFWRDVFLNNRDAVLEMLQRFTEDLSRLQRAIRHGEGEVLFQHFARAREIRRGVIDARQA